MIEVKNQTNEKYQAYVDGQLLEYTNVSFLPEINQFLLKVNSYDDVDKVCSQNLSEIPKNLRLELLAKNNIKLDERFLESSEHLIRGIWITTDDQEDYFIVGIKFGTNLLRWRKPYKYADYLTAFINTNDFFKQYAVEFKKHGESIFALIEFFSKKMSILEAVSKSSSILFEHHKQIETYLSNSLGKDSLITSFNFPENLKISCGQYLLYFAQFLQDLEINATSNLKEEAGKVLFSVMPTDDVEALDKIREALAIYLHFPSSPVAYNESFAAMRLQQQIENLQHSQRMAVRELQFNEKLLIAQSDTIREKNITISQQHLVIENQNNIIEKISSRSIMMDSVEDKEELEEIYEGVKVGESKWLKELTGISLNPATVIKTAVKNTFGKDEKKSVLGLDED